MLAKLVMEPLCNSRFGFVIASFSGFLAKASHLVTLLNGQRDKMLPCLTGGSKY